MTKTETAQTAPPLLVGEARVAAGERAACYLGALMPSHEEHLDDVVFANLADALARRFVEVEAWLAQD